MDAALIDFARERAVAAGGSGLICRHGILVAQWGDVDKKSMLMVDGRLYMLARNTDNAQLAWSDDRGQNWRWASWKFNTSFGCPCFLGCGPNYRGARDDYVYLYSPDTHSAYVAGDAVVMARVLRDQVTAPNRYEYFAGLDKSDQPSWSSEVDERKPVFKSPGRCYRMSVNYHPQLDRYLMCQIMPESWHRHGQRFEGGFGIYESPQPWGPWSTVYFTNHWDVGPGETASLPPNWAADNVLHLVFSGDDCFSVRRALLSLDQ